MYNFNENKISSLLLKDHKEIIKELIAKRDKGIGVWCSKCQSKHPKEIKCKEII